MPITDLNTVLILGAGSSQPFGLPLGGGLIGDVHTGLTTALGRNGWLNQHNLSNAAAWPESFATDPLGSAIATRWFVKSTTHQVIAEEIQRARQLHSLLEGQTAETIDDFIALNPGVAEFAKLCVAARMLYLCYDWSRQGGMPGALKAFAARTLNGSERNWVHRLINLCRHGYRLGWVTPENPVKIISFNYDMVLEHVLDAQWKNTEIDLSSWEDVIKVVHVHGSFLPLEPSCREPGKVAAEWAAGLHVVNEASTIPSVEDARQTAKLWIREASEIYAVGFAFAGSNLRTIGLEKRRAPRLIRFCNYDGNAGVRRSVERLSNSPIHKDIDEAAPNPAVPLQRNLSITDWLHAGHLGEMP